MLPLLSYDILNLIVQNYLSDFDVLRGLGITSSDFRRYAKGYTTKRQYSLCSVMNTTSDVKFVDVYAETFYLEHVYYSNPEKYNEKMKHCTTFTYWMDLWEYMDSGYDSYHTERRISSILKEVKHTNKKFKLRTDRIQPKIIKKKTKS
jgi:hypothetical protein